MQTLEHSPLGKTSAGSDHYDPGLLFALERGTSRADLGLPDALPFHGMDQWTAYELSWLDMRGKPRVAMARFEIPADSPRLIESKSFKLYLNSLAGERLGEERLPALLRADLSAAAGAEVEVELVPAVNFGRQQLVPLAGTVIDDLELDVDCYGPPQADFLDIAPGPATSETLVSHLLRSNCPVTGQPDWGSVQIRYSGKPVDRAGLLRYLVSFRNHQAFHEACVERMYLDIMARCQPLTLSVHARYTRRGGLDINPFRSSQPQARPIITRTARQ